MCNEEEHLKPGTRKGHGGGGRFDQPALLVNWDNGQQPFLLIEKTTSKAPQQEESPGMHDELTYWGNQLGCKGGR